MFESLCCKLTAQTFVTAGCCRSGRVLTSLFNPKQWAPCNVCLSNIDRGNIDGPAEPASEPGVTCSTLKLPASHLLELKILKKRKRSKRKCLHVITSNVVEKLPVNGQRCCASAFQRVCKSPRRCWNAQRYRKREKEGERERQTERVSYCCKTRLKVPK